MAISAGRRESILPVDHRIARRQNVRMLESKRPQTRLLTMVSARPNPRRCGLPGPEPEETFARRHQRRFDGDHPRDQGIQIDGFRGNMPGEKDQPADAEHNNVMQNGKEQGNLQELKTRP